MANKIYSLKDNAIEAIIAVDARNRELGVATPNVCDVVENAKIIVPSDIDLRKFCDMASTKPEYAHILLHGVYTREVFETMFDDEWRIYAAQCLSKDRIGAATLYALYEESLPEPMLTAGRNADPIIVEIKRKGHNLREWK